MDIHRKNLNLNSSFFLILLLFFFTFSPGCQLKPEVDNVSSNEKTGVSLDTTPPTPAFDTLPIDRRAEYIMGKFDPATHPGFVPLDESYTDRPGMQLRSDTYHYFLMMAEHAALDTIKLVIRSATRNFDQQKSIWERKWEGKTLLEDRLDARQISDPAERARAILRYSSMPGTSRHHWGTDVDLNAFTNKYFEEGEGKRIYDWLLSHASTYGFCQPYTSKDNGRTGYEEEKWHWSFTPVSAVLTQVAKTTLANTDIQGFLGADQAGTIGVIENYVLGIDQSCHEPH